MCKRARSFFFSSRRRHTRCSRDWSSDVCSSDLVAGDIAKDGGADAGIQDAVVADQVDDKNPDTKGLVTQAMQDIGGKKDADRGIGDDEIGRASCRERV